MAWILYLLQNQFGVVEVIHEPYLKIFGGVEPQTLRLLSVALYHTAMKLTKYLQVQV